MSSEIDELIELLDKLYISVDRMDSKAYIKTLSVSQYKALVSLGLPTGGNRATLWVAIKFLEDKINGNSSRS